MAIEFRKASPEQTARGISHTLTVPKGKLDPDAIREAAKIAVNNGIMSETDAMALSAVLPATKGRPPSGKAKKAVTIRLDQDVVKALEGREDWRSEVNSVLRRHLGLL